MSDISKFTNDSSLNAEINEEYVIKAYEHICTMYKFYLNLRYIILGASLAVLSFILTNFANSSEAPMNNYKRILIFLGMGTCIIFYLMDLRTRTLFRESRAAGKKIELEHMKVQGFYSYMTDNFNKKGGFFNKIGYMLGHSQTIGLSYLFIFVLFVYLLIVSYQE